MSSNTRPADEVPLISEPVTSCWSSQREYAHAHHVQQNRQNETARSGSSDFGESLEGLDMSRAASTMELMFRADHPSGGAVFEHSVTLRLATAVALLLCVSPSMGDQRASDPPREVIADSVAGFSGEQGFKGWSYGYWSPAADSGGAYNQASSFRLLPHFGDDPINGLSRHAEFTTGRLWNLVDGRYYTSLWATGGHPNSPVPLGEHAGEEQWVVRRWVSTTRGPVTIRGYAGKTMPWGAAWGGGVEVRIVVDGETLYRADIGDERTDYSFESSLEVGSIVDFLMGPGPSVGVVDFTATIEGSGLTRYH